MLNINFEFVGGPNDGQFLRGRSGELSDAERYYLCSHHGTVENRIKVASQLAVDTLASEHLRNDIRHVFQRHFYVVTDRVEDGFEVWVRAEYLP